MNFGSQNYLYLIALVPLLLIFVFRSKGRHKRRFERFAEAKFYDYFLGEFSHFFWNLKNIILLISLVFLTIALAKPRWDSESQTVEKQGVDIVIALDISKSMDAADIKPSRLERAKDVLSFFLDQLTGDRVSLVVFAGKSVVQSPLTDDYNTLKLFVNMQTSDNISSLGTNIGDALQSSVDVFDQTNKQKMILLISDGEDLQNGAVQKAREIAKMGARVYVIGIGTPNGDPITTTNAKGDITYIKDGDGNIVLSKLDIKTLSEIASKTNGRFFTISPNQSEVFEIIKQIQQMEKQSFESKVFVKYKEQYKLFALISLILLFVEFPIFHKIKKRDKRSYI